MLGILCSPNQNGVTDHLCNLVEQGYGGFEKIALRSLHMQSCRGCQVCLQNGGKCILPFDDADVLFERMQGGTGLVFFSPVYFYAVPWLFKLFIDRSQKFWRQKGRQNRVRKAWLVLAAGRNRGEKLFAGSVLTVKYFLEPFGRRLEQPLQLRGLNTTGDITHAVKEELLNFGAFLRSAAQPVV